MITKVVKVTHVQMQTLLNGGTVAGHTYDPTHCLYIEDTGAELPTESGSFMLSSNDGGQTFSYTSPLVEFDDEDVAGFHAMVIQNPAIQFIYEGYIYSPIVQGSDIPFVYSSMQPGESKCYFIQFDWDEEAFADRQVDVLSLSTAKNYFIQRQVYEVDAVTRPIPQQGTNYVVYHITAPEITALTSGLTVRVHKPLASVFPNDSNGAVKLLQINNLTPIALFWRYNSMINWNQLDNVYMTLTYSPNARSTTSDYYGYTRADGFILDYTYDSGNDTYNLYDYGPYQTGSLPLTTGSITGWDANGKRIPIIQRDGTLNTTVPFVVHAGLTYYDGSNRSANTQYGYWNGQFWLRKETALFQASFLAARGLSSATNNTQVYLKCSISGITATPVGLVTALPNSADGYYYIYLMRAYDLYTGTGSSRNWTFELEHPIYSYRNGKVAEGIDEGYYLTTGSATQTRAGDLTLNGTTTHNGFSNFTNTIEAYKDLNIGTTVQNSRDLAQAPNGLQFLSLNRRASAIEGFYPFSGVGDWLYAAEQKSQFTIRSTFKGTGLDSDVYKADFYTTADEGTGGLQSLFNWTYTNGWRCLPSKISASTPAIIEIKSSTQMTYTDVLRLVLTGHSGRGGYNYSGALTDYTIEVCTDYTNNTWVTVVSRSGVEDKISDCPMYSLQTGGYTPCFGIRLTITGAIVTTSSSRYDYINITTIQLRDYRPDFTVTDAVGALSTRGGTITGEVFFGGNSANQRFAPAVTNTGRLGTDSQRWYEIHANSIREGGVELGKKYFSPSNTAGTYLATRNTNGTISSTSASDVLKGTYDSTTGILTISKI